MYKNRFFGVSDLRIPIAETILPIHRADLNTLDLAGGLKHLNEHPSTNNLKIFKSFLAQKGEGPGYYVKTEYIPIEGSKIPGLHQPVYSLYTPADILKCKGTAVEYVPTLNKVIDPDYRGLDLHSSPSATKLPSITVESPTSSDDEELFYKRGSSPLLPPAEILEGKDKSVRFESTPSTSHSSILGVGDIPSSSYERLTYYDALDILNENPSPSNIREFLKVAGPKWNITKADLIKKEGGSVNYSWLTKQRLGSDVFSISNSEYADQMTLFPSDTLGLSLDEFVRVVNRSGVLTSNNIKAIPGILSEAYGINPNEIKIKSTIFGNSRIELQLDANRHTKSRYIWSKVGLDPLGLQSKVDSISESRATSPSHSDGYSTDTDTGVTESQFAQSSLDSCFLLKNN